MIDILWHAFWYGVIIFGATYVFDKFKKKAPAYTAKFSRDVQRELALKP